MEFGAEPEMMGAEDEQQQVGKMQASILSPIAEIEDLELSDLIDSQELQSLVEDFYALAHMPMSIIDLKGRMLVGVGWQNVCLNFHRVHPVTCANCLESDLKLSSGVMAGEFKLYKCRNNMWDIATPILIGGRHVGNLFSGQFFFDDELPDYELFRVQARQYGFDENAYLAAVDQAPRLSRETVNRSMAFFVKLAHMISRLGFSNLQLSHSLAERETLMDSLRESEHRWQTTLTSVGDGVIATDVDGKVTFMNQVAEELTGWPLAEAKQQPVEDVFHIINESTRQMVDNPVRKVLRTGIICGLANHSLLVRRDGSEISIDDSAAPIHGADGQITGTVLVFRDITERRRAEREQAWLASFPLLNPNPIVEINPEARVEYSNQKARDLFPGLPEQGIAHPYLVGWEEIAAGLRSDPTLVIDREVRVDDHYYQQSIYYSQEYGRIRAYGIDITARKQAEEVVRKSAEELARSNRELEAFAYIASHDLNEPLRKIEMFGKILVDAAAPLDECQQDYLRRMIGASRRMREMVDGLLTLSRVMTQGQPFAPVDLAKTLQEVLSDLEMQLQRTGGSVEGCALPVIQADALQIRQLFQNLIGNALKYHRPEVPPRVKMSCEKIDPNSLVIQIEDNGIGFEESQTERIFQPFHRLVGRSEFEGSGLGLAICRKIVERHSGGIIARSTPGRGSTFVVTLPIQRSG